MLEVLDSTRLNDAVELANMLGNTPGIHDAVCPGPEYLDMAYLFKRPRTCIIGDRLGALLMQHLSGDIFGMHYLLTPLLRGKKALDFCNNVADIMFTMRGAELICGAVPRENRGSRAMTRALHGTPIGESIDLYGRRCLNYVLDKVQWAQLRDQRPQRARI